METSVLFQGVAHGERAVPALITRRYCTPAPAPPLPPPPPPATARRRHCLSVATTQCPCHTGPMEFSDDCWAPPLHDDFLQPQVTVRGLQESARRSRARTATLLALRLINQIMRIRDELFIPNDKCFCVITIIYHSIPPNEDYVNYLWICFY